jgi:hypothetical protein
MRILIVILGIIFLFVQIKGHGMLWNPVGRASRWRFNASAPHNWNDNELYCGGWGTQHNVNGGECGLCGDNWQNPTPRAHELGGQFGEGVIVESYKQGSDVNIIVRITANHRGRFIFDICNVDQQKESDECFQRNPVQLTNGKPEYEVTDFSTGNFNVALRLPANLSCNHCVIRWTYIGANLWNWCGDGTGALVSF